MKALLLALGVVFSCETFGGDRVTGQPFATRSEVIASHGMAATSQPLATQVALDILKQGGNAIYAARYTLIDRKTVAILQERYKLVTLEAGFSPPDCVLPELSQYFAAKVFISRLAL